MTTLTAILGLLPAALSHGIGSQSQKPLAIVVIGGALNLMILTRLVQPPLCVIAYRWLERRPRPQGARGDDVMRAGRRRDSVAASLLVRVPDARLRSGGRRGAGARGDGHAAGRRLAVSR